MLKKNTREVNNMGQIKRVFEKYQEQEILDLINEMFDYDYQYEMWKEKKIQQYEETLRIEEEKRRV